MHECSVLFICPVACFVVCAILLVHHKCKHSRRGPAFIENECEQWFQWRLYPEGDVCNFTTCSHEMWCILFALVGVVALIVATTANVDCH